MDLFYQCPLCIYQKMQLDCQNFTHTSHGIGTNMPVEIYEAAEILKPNSQGVYGKHRLQQGGWCRSEGRWISKNSGTTHTISDPSLLFPTCGHDPQILFVGEHDNLKKHFDFHVPWILCCFLSRECWGFFPGILIKNVSRERVDLPLILLFAAQTTWYEALRCFGI